jgi:hypothetical protein
MAAAGTTRLFVSALAHRAAPNSHYLVEVSHGSATGIRTLHHSESRDGAWQPITRCDARRFR